MRGHHNTRDMSDAYNALKEKHLREKQRIWMMSGPPEI
jgi:hypothetical protein